MRNCQTKFTSLSYGVMFLDIIDLEHAYVHF